MSKAVFCSILAIVLTSTLLVGCSRSRTDAEIASEVQNKINSDSSIATKQVAAAANGGVVTLSGTVGNDTERNVASRDASEVQGVKTVLNNLQLAPAAAANVPAEGTPPVRQKAKPSNSVVRKSVPPVSARSNNPEVAKELPSITIPQGTALSIRLIDTIDSERNKAGDTFSATLESPLVADGRVVAPQKRRCRG